MRRTIHKAVLLLIAASFPALAAFPWDTRNMWVNFESCSNGSAPTGACLISSTSGDAGSWDTSQQGGLMSISATGQSPTSAFGDTGVRGLSYDLSNGGAQYTEWNLPANKTQVSIGMAYKTGGNFATNQEGPHFLTLFNFGFGNMMRLSDERDGGSNQRQIRVSPDVVAVAVADNTWYWVAWSWQQNSTGTLSIYTLPGLTLVGSVSYTDSTNVAVQGILFGNSSATTGIPAQTTYFDNFTISYTASNFPMLPSVGCDPGNMACYVRAGAGGTASGADWTNAYTTLPATLTRGATYYVATGSYTRYTADDADSGTDVITIQAPTVAAHGTATGWSNAYQGQAVFACALACSTIIQFTTDYWVFNGVYRSSASGSPAVDWILESGYGFKTDNSGSHKAGVSFQGGLGFNGPPDSTHNITIEYVDVKGSAPASDSDNLDTGFDFEGGSYNILMSHNYNHDDWLPYYIKGNHASTGGFGTGDGNTIEYSYNAHNFSSSMNHAEGCSCSEGLTNFTVRYNYWTDMIGTGYLATPSGASYNTGNGNNGPWYVYGNVFMATAAGISGSHCGTGDGMLVIFDATFTNGTVYFLNNTIANFSGCNALNNGFGMGLSFTTPMASLVSQNNLIWKTDVVTVVNTGTTSFDGATFSPAANWSYNAWFQIPDSSASNDTDANKQVSSSNPFTNSTTYDWSLTGHTTTGTSTAGTVAGNSVDLLGNTRGSGGWDRGAFQYPGSGGSPAGAVISGRGYMSGGVVN